MSQRIICAALIAICVSSCQKQASGQTVAVVNGQEVTASELNAQIASDASLAGQPTEQARKQALQTLISRKLLVQQAKSKGIDKSPEFLTQLQRGTDDLLINMLLAGQIKSASTPSAQDIDRFEAQHPQMFGNREIWTVSEIIYPLPRSPAVTTKIAGADSLDAVAQVLSASGIQFTRATRKIDTAAFPNDIMAQLSKLKPNEPFIAPGPDKAVASVITGREAAVPPADQARALAIAGMRREQTSKILEDRIKSLKASAKIEYQPGYGPTGK